MARPAKIKRTSGELASITSSISAKTAAGGAIAHPNDRTEPGRGDWSATVAGPSHRSSLVTTLTPASVVCLSRLTPYLTPYGVVTPGSRRTKFLFGCPSSNTKRPHPGTPERA